MGCAASRRPDRNKRKEKQFFFEKKNQKTFVYWLGLTRRIEFLKLT